MHNLPAGTLVITDRGTLAMLIVDGPQTEMSTVSGPVKYFYEGLTLPNLSKWKNSVARKVGHIDDIVLPFLETIDRTPATKGTEELSDKELLQRVLAENAELKKRFDQLAASK
jgi:hypothetical protein